MQTILLQMLIMKINTIYGLCQMRRALAVLKNRLWGALLKQKAMWIKFRKNRFFILDQKMPTKMATVFFCTFLLALLTMQILFTAQIVFASHTDGASISLESKVDKKEITIGDPIHYTITTTMPKGIELTLPHLGSNLGEFEIQDYQISGPTEQEDRIVHTIDYTIAAYDVGSYHIPPVEIQYKTIEGEQKTISSEVIEIKVKAVAPEDAADIKDIKGPLDIKKNWAPYRKIFLWLTLALILTVLVFGCIRYYRKKKISQDRGPELRRPAHEIAYEELKMIWETFLENNLIKEFYLHLSEITRHYFSRRYQINALEATTEELIQELKNQHLHWRQKSLISNFLDECDLVKFAKYIPKMIETEKTYQLALQIIDETKIKTDIPEANISSAVTPESMNNTKKVIQG